MFIQICYTCNVLIKVRDHMRSTSPLKIYFPQILLERVTERIKAYLLAGMLSGISGVENWQEVGIMDPLPLNSSHFPINEVQSHVD